MPTYDQMWVDKKRGEAAKIERDKALTAVKKKSGEWFADAMAALEGLELEGEFTGEDIRHMVVEIVGDPHHHNTWGALIKQAVERGIIEETGEFVQMQDKQSHARRSPVYRRAA